jgi:serpin B
MLACQPNGDNSRINLCGHDVLDCAERKNQGVAKMKAWRKALILGVATMVVSGCSAAEEAGGSREKVKANEQLVVGGNNEFALKLYERLRSQEGNLFFSPYSISTALAMTYAGARGQTASQMADVLCFPVEAGKAGKLSSDAGVLPRLDPQELASAFGSLVKDLNVRGQKGVYKLDVANALWGQKGYGFRRQFLDFVEKYYGGRLNEVDFAGAAEKARQTINAWVEKQTNDKIKDLIAKGVLDSMTRLVLTNAIYFKGDWASKFDKDRTQNAPFTLSDGQKIDVPMMNQTKKFGYMATDTFQALELPYAKGELSMIILLPKEMGGLGALEKSLTLKDLSQWLGVLGKREVVVSIPKFKLTSKFSLASVLKAMGMTDAFSRSADFSGMDGKRDLFISAVIHKAYVDVNEEGTEAAAATAVTMKLTSIGPGGRPPVFRADHPFLFLIRDNQSGSILFLGRVMNPQK